MRLVPDALSRNSSGPDVVANFSSPANVSVEEERISLKLRINLTTVRDDSSRSDQKFVLPRTFLGCILLIDWPLVIPESGIS